MTLEEIDREECFLSISEGIQLDVMTQELAQREANADHYTERQEMMMGGRDDCL